MYDFSKPPAAASKWRCVTEQQRRQQAETAHRLRQEAAALAAGEPVPDPVRSLRSRRDATGDPGMISRDEKAALREFMAVHGREIGGMLARADSDDDRLRLAHAYRAILRGEPGAHEAWSRALVKAGL